MRFVEGVDELGTYTVKPNYRTLGPRFGREMPLVAEAIAALDPARVAVAIRGGAAGEPALGISVAGREHTLSAEDVILTLRPPEGFAVEREGAHAVALDLTVDEDLRREGRAREIVRAVQNARKSAGLQVEDRIALTLDGDPKLLDAAREHRDYIAGETLAVGLSLDGERSAGAAEARGAAEAAEEHREQAKVDGLTLTIALARAT